MKITKNGLEVSFVIPNIKKIIHDYKVFLQDKECKYCGAALEKELQGRYKVCSECGKKQ